MSRLHQQLLAELRKTVEGSASGYIGVGWVFGAESYDFVCTREDGKNFDGNLHPPFNHKQRFEHEVLRKVPTLLAVATYTTLPRYRVYWEVDHNVVVGWGPLVERRKFQEHVMGVYRLVRPRFTTDAHYNGLEWGPEFMGAQRTLRHW